MAGRTGPSDNLVSVWISRIGHERATFACFGVTGDDHRRLAGQINRDHDEGGIAPAHAVGGNWKLAAAIQPTGGAGS